MTRLRVVRGDGGEAEDRRDEGRGAMPPDLRATVPLDARIEEIVRHESIDGRALGLFGALLGALLVFVTLLAPEIWREPVSRLAGPLAAYVAPWILLAAREVLGRGVVVVTGDGLGVRSFGRPPVFVRYRAVRRVRRALLLGGVVLETARGRIWLPGRLAERARDPIARARRSEGRLASLAGDLVDPTGFLSGDVSRP
ncbi:MAG: hypothetical protein D6705_02965 [Deltaproteobacteria bacterium]|nr:MAG: hypothetical protein D6705_02965 [Deltaproteobacteria bacterium]